MVTLCLWRSIYVKVISHKYRSFSCLSSSLSLHAYLPSHHRQFSSLLIFTDEDYDREFNKVIHMDRMDLTRQHDLTYLNDRRVFVDNLDERVAWDELRDIMSEFGHVDRSHVLRDRSERSTGAATIIYSTVESATKAIKALNNRKIKSKHITVKPGIIRMKKPLSAKDYFDVSVTKLDDDKESHPSFAVFVKNIPFHISSIQLAKHFRSCGEVVNCDIYHDRFGKSIGRGVVRYASKVDADEAKHQLNKTVFNDRIMEVIDFKPVEPNKHRK